MISNDIALEIDAFFRDIKSGWRYLDTCDKLTTYSALLILLAIFFPWTFGDSGQTYSGIMAGGGIPFVLSLKLFNLVLGAVKIKRESATDSPKKNLYLRRNAIFIILIGFGLCGISFISLFYHTAMNLDVLFGFYISLTGSLITIFSGILFFTK